jgi:3-hydroxybutyryl-CoA dehydrogenase
MADTFLLGPDSAVGVVGAGAMGSGIAQLAAVRGHPVLLTDAYAPALSRAREGIASALEREVSKGRLTSDARDATLERMVLVDPSAGLAAFADCHLVIEAIVETLDVKQASFAALEKVVGERCVLATNTSSLSVASIGAACADPSRVLGVHFFNPPTVLPLVEIVPGVRTSAPAVTATRALIDTWGKTTVIAADTPGFIVNRVARPFYGESIRLLEEGVADCATIDWAMKERGGFRMGPFELMDFIGHDVNFTVTQSVYEGLFYDPRYRPSLTQRRLLEAGLLGRKTGHGFYDYTEGAAKPEPTRDESLGEAIVARVLAMLINEAVDAVHLRIASPADIETAMTKGVNYPRGLLSWGDAIGLGTVLTRLEALQQEYGEDRYRPSPLLRRMVREGTSFFA